MKSIRTIALLIGFVSILLTKLTYSQISVDVDYRVEPYYVNPHSNANQIIVSFDWDHQTNLYYSTGSAMYDLGFGVYRFDGNNLTTIYTNPNVFAGSRVTRIGNYIYFNDGGNYTNWTYTYYFFNTTSIHDIINLGVVDDIWGLETRSGNDFWAAGGFNAAIYYSPIGANGTLLNNPLVKIGTVGGASGPLAFDKNGNLYYAEGYNTNGARVYRWNNEKITNAIANPSNAPITTNASLFTVLASGDGSTAMAIDQSGNPLITATSFSADSQLHRLLTLNGMCLGYEVIATSTERLSALRLNNGKIYVGCPSGIYSIEPIKTTSLAAQMDNGTLVLVRLNGNREALKVSFPVALPQGYMLRGIDSNKLLIQGGIGGAVIIAELGTNDTVISSRIIAQSVPGWIARSINANKILAQAGDNGAVVIATLNSNYQIANITTVAQSSSGWIARDFDENKILIQRGDGGPVAIAYLNDNYTPINIKNVCGPIPGWVVRAIRNNMVLAQNINNGSCLVVKLDENANVIGYKIVLNPITGVSILGLDIE